MALTKVSTGVVDMSGNTGGLVIAKGNDLERPASPSIGMIRENTETTPSKVEVYTDNSGTPTWQFLEEVGPTFIPLTVDYLVIAGGGGGGSSFGASGSGGGAGEYLTSIGGTSLQLVVNTTYNVIVGAGGAGGAGGVQANGTSGSNSQFISSTYLARGGGAGTCSSVPTASIPGGSGGGADTQNMAGGASTAVSPGLGFAGGATGAHGGVYPSAGGGGAGAVGEYAAGTSGGGDGGAGVSTSITGTSAFYAAGGGGGLFGPSGYTNVGIGGSSIGGSSSLTGNASGGAANTGSGGGGGSYSTSTVSFGGGRGADGIVILRYPSIYAITFQTGVGFISSTATLSATSEKVTTITAGSGTITFALTP